MDRVELVRTADNVTPEPLWTFERGGTSSPNYYYNNTGNYIKFEHLPKNVEESYEWLKQLFDSKTINSKVEYITQNSNKTKDGVLKEAIQYSEIRYGLMSFENLMNRGERTFKVAKEECLDMFSKIGYDFEFIKNFDNKFFGQSSNVINEIERLRLVLAGIWDAVISNLEEILISNLGEKGIRHFPIGIINQVLVLEFFTRNFVVINKYSEFFNVLRWPASMNYHKDYAIITLAECKKKGFHRAIQNNKVKQVTDEFVQTFVKSRNRKITTFGNEVMPKTNGTYNVLMEMLDEIVVPWIGEYSLDQIDGTYRNVKNGHVLAFVKI